MKAFKVFWKDRINEEGQPWLSESIVIAENMQKCLEIAWSYGIVTHISEEKSLITEPKKAPVLQ